MLLRDKDRERLLLIFSSAASAMEVWAYGSRVNGTAHESSDLDLVIRSLDGKPLPQHLVSSLRERIRNSNIPILVELRDWAKLPASFHESILVRHEVLYSTAVADREGQPS